MNTTIAVALITAISTLSGAAISGRITFLVTRTQINSQLELADKNLSVQDAQERRKVQRDVYVQFLTKASEIQNKLSVWATYPPVPIDVPQNVTDEFNEDLDEIVRLQYLVVIESPDNGLFEVSRDAVTGS